jgi:alpha-ribazole phosphatase
VIPARAAGATRVILVRHAEPEPSHRGRCYGRLDVPLSPAGRVHAEEIAQALAREAPAGIYASPLERAAKTAQPLARALDLPVVTREALQEIDFGAFEGLSYAEIERRHPAEWATWMAAPTEVEFPGGESYPRLVARVTGELARLRAAHRSQTVALFSHAGPIRVLLSQALDVSERELFSIAVDYGAVSVLDEEGGRVTAPLVNRDMRGASRS